jgi:predicted CXXCH cytochrome family protein
VNKAVKGRTCRACHETHASNFPKHIREAVPFGSWDLPVNFEKTESGGSCAPGCHKEKKYDRAKRAVNE